MEWEGEPPGEPFVTNGSTGASPAQLNRGIHKTAIGYIQTIVVVLRRVFKQYSKELFQLLLSKRLNPYCCDTEGFYWHCYSVLLCRKDTLIFLYKVRFVYL